MPDSSHTPVSVRGSNTAVWVIAVLLALVAGSLWSRPYGQGAGVAWGQSPPLAGARGVYAFTGQIDHNRYGLFMLDIEQGTVWCYEIESTGGVRKLRLIAARSWVYDRYLRDFNCADPDFRQVQQLVAQQREAAATSGGSAVDGPQRDAQPLERQSP